MQNTVPLSSSCLFALFPSSLPSSPFPFRLGRPLRLSPFLQFPASVRPGQKTRPRAARCFLKGGRPRPRPISGSNAGGRGISSPGGRRRRRGSGEMRWLSQKLTAKIDRPADAAPSSVRRPPFSPSFVLFVGGSSSVGKRAKKGAAVAPLARSLASFVPPFFRRRRRRWRRLQLPHSSTAAGADRGGRSLSSALCLIAF